MRSYLTHPAGVPVWVAEVRVVKRTYGWLGRGPRMVKDYENLTRSHIGFIILAMIRLMLRRIARLTTSR